MILSFQSYTCDIARQKLSKKKMLRLTSGALPSPSHAWNAALVPAGADLSMKLRDEVISYSSGTFSKNILSSHSHRVKFDQFHPGR